MKKISYLFLAFFVFLLVSCDDKGCEHQFEKYKVHEVTCTTDGYTEYKCINCQEIFKDDVVRAKGHQIEISISGANATCDEAGLTDERKCSVCNLVVINQVEIPALGHDYDEWVEITKPTKETSGLIKRVCKNDANHVEEFVLPSLESPGYNYQLNDSTCKVVGSEVYYLTKDNQTFTYEVEVPLKPHSYTGVITKPTCELEGYTTYTCSCGDSYVDHKVAALGHSYQSVVTAPTCEADGYTTHTCRCGDTYTDTTVAALGHSYTLYESNADATCTLDGTKTAKCDNKCGKTNTIADEGSALGHSHESVVTAPTCEESGYTTHTCHCGDTYTDTTVAALGHSYTIYESNADATCTLDGTKTAKCDNECGKTNTIADEGSALGHSYESVVTAPTCEESGYTTHTCHCGDTYTDTTVAALGHNYIKSVILPTCEADGYTEYKCSHDNSHFYTSDFVDKLGHLFTEYVSDNNATCAANGTKTANCDNQCGKTDTIEDEDSILAHSFKSTIVDPTCEESGYTIYVCEYDSTHYYIDKNSYVDAIGHIYMNYVYNDDATCLDDGTEKAYCENKCGKFITRVKEGSATGHEYHDVITPPTCTTGGYTTHYCKNDSMHDYTDTLTPATGHKFATYNVQSAATCEEAEKKIANCDNGCGETDVIVGNPATGHAYGEWKLVSKPTEIAVGSIRKICANDNQHIVTKELPRLNQADYSLTGSAATCTTNGRLVYTYEIDGQSFGFEVFKQATGHNYIAEVFKPTCEEDGYTLYTCHCSSSYQDSPVPALGHNVYVSNEAYDPMCIYPGGTEEQSCSRCSEIILEAKVIAALGHIDSDLSNECDRCLVPLGADVIKVSTFDDLKAIANNLGANYQLVNDIEVTDSRWNGIGDADNPFTGYFNGNGFTILKLYSNLFYKNEGTIDSLHIKSASISNGTNRMQNYTEGIFTTINNGTIKNCRLIGANRMGATIYHDFEAGSGKSSTITYQGIMGGFSAINYGNITNCMMDGTFTTICNASSKHTLNLIELNLGLFEIPLQIYNGEHSTTTVDYYVGVFAGINHGTIDGGILKGRHSDNITVNADLGSNLGRAIATLNDNIALVCGDNKGTVKNIKASIERNVSENVEAADTDYANVYVVGTSSHLNHNNVDGYENLIAKNSGTIESVVSLK